MNNSVLHIFSLLFISVMLTGCYTQLQTVNRGGDYYYDHFAALKEAGIYYKDYETEKWYNDHYANNYKWTENGERAKEMLQAQDSIQTSTYYEAWAGNVVWYKNPHFNHRHYKWDEGFGLHFGYTNCNMVPNLRFDLCGYNPSGFWYYNPAGYWSFWYYPYSSFFHQPYSYTGWGIYSPYIATYNDYIQDQRYQRYRERSPLYRKRSSGHSMTNNNGYRSRSSDAIHRTRSTSNSTYNGNSRVRSTGRSTTGRSSGSVGRTRGSSSEGGSSSSGSRSRGGDS